MRRILHALSFDYDDCLLPRSSDAAITYPSIVESNKRLLKAIRKQNDDFNSTTGYIGSSRQSHGTDKTNRRETGTTTIADPTSCFIPVRRLIEEEMKAFFSPFLLADTYELKPEGTAYHQAITANETAHHVSWVFDDSKSSIIYLQAHLAAQEARGCDFISLKEKPNWETLPTRSHAAYVYLEDTKKLYYVNKIDHTHSELSIPDNSSWSTFLEAATEQLSAETQSFQRSMIDSSDKIIEGIILSDAQLKTINSITQHQHKKEDHPIVFDFYDDRTDILFSLRDLLYAFGELRVARFSWFLR